MKRREYDDTTVEGAFKFFAFSDHIQARLSLAISP